MINVSIARLLLSVFISLVYASFLFILQDDFFKDRGNYVNYALYNLDVMDRYSGLSFLFNEPLFLIYNRVLTVFFPPELVPRVTVFFISFTFMFFIARHSKKLFLFGLGGVSLLFVYFTFHQQLVVLRQGLATALLLWFVCCFFYKKYFLLLVLFLGFIHTSFFLVFFVICADKLLSFFLKDIKYRVFCLIASMFFMSFFMLQVAEFLGVRQATASHLVSNDNSGGGFLLFLFLSFFLYLRGMDNVSCNRYGYMTLIGFSIYLAFYFTVPVSGRMIGTFLPFYYIYFVSDFHPKIFFPAVIFVLVSVFIFYGTIVSSSLTPDGVIYLNNLLGL